MYIYDNELDLFFICFLVSDENRDVSPAQAVLKMTCIL